MDIGIGIDLNIIIGIVAVLIALAFATKNVQQTQRGLIERFGRFNRYAEPGLHFIIPFIESIERVEITESMMEIDTQEIITEDNLNAKVDLIVYYKVKDGSVDAIKNLHSYPGTNKRVSAKETFKK